jgi:hypothetical protein
MALSNRDQSNVREYLLGTLSDEAQEAMEERLMVDDELFQEFEISKGELIEEYSAGELRQKERDWFGSHYLASDEGSERRLFAAALGTVGSRQPTPKPVGLFDRIRAVLAQRPQLIGLTTAAVAVAVTIGLWLTSPTAQTSLAVTLTNSTMKRSITESQYQTIALKPDVGELKFSLPLPESAKNAAKYRVELDNRYQIRSLTPSASDGNLVLVIIPARQVPDGLYALTLYAIQSDGNEQAVPGQYFFEIKRIVAT